MSRQRWDRAWARALYGPDGFYRRAAPAEHFATSAQGLGTTGALLAEALVVLAERHGLTTIVEVAAGRGELLTAIAERAPDLELVGLDVVERPADLPAGIGWLTSPGGALLPDSLTELQDTLLLAHEWLDVIPCPVVARSGAGRWHHVLVDAEGSEELGAEVAGPDLQWLAAHVPNYVERAEIGRPRDTAYSSLVSRVSRGVVLAVDYGHTRATRPVAGSLTGFREGTQVSPVPDATCDLTAHVAIDSLGADHLSTQREAIHDLLGSAELPDHALSRTDPAGYLRALGRTNALATLTATHGLGGFWWAMTLRGQGCLG